MREKLRHLLHGTKFKGGAHSRPRDESLSPCRTPEPHTPGNASGGQPETPKRAPAPSLALTTVMQEQLDLRLASGESRTVVMELDLDCNIRYVSKSWEALVGTSVRKITGKPISEILIGTSEADLAVFNDAVAHMIADNASYKVTFVTATNDATDTNGATDTNPEQLLPESGLPRFQPGSPLLPTATSDALHAFGVQAAGSLPPLLHLSGTSSKVSNDGDVIELEAQGILIVSSATNLPTHSIWTIRPYMPIDLELTIPEALVDLLGFGSEIFEGYLVSLREAGIIDEDSVPEPKVVLCRICETNVPAWFIEKHSDLCLLEHKVEEELQFCHDNIVDQRDLIVRISESLWYQQFECASLPSTPGSSSSSMSLASMGLLLVHDYKGIPLPAVGLDAGLRALFSAMNPSIQQSRKFPFGILLKLIDFCDEALLINAAEKLPVTGCFGYSPTTENAIHSIMNWQSLETSDPAMKAMVEDTKQLATDKVQEITRLVSFLQYSDKIKQEVDNLVLDTVQNTVAKIREKIHEQQSLTRLLDASIASIPDSRAKQLAHATSDDLILVRNSSVPSFVTEPPAHDCPKLHSPQPSRMRSPSTQILQDQLYDDRLRTSVPSFTPQDLLQSTAPLMRGLTSVSPNTSTTRLPMRDLQESLGSLEVFARTSDCLSLNSSMSSPRRKLSPTPYVEKQSFSTLQRNTNAFSKADSSPRIVPYEKSDSSLPAKNLPERNNSSSSLMLPSLANPTSFSGYQGSSTPMSQAYSGHLAQRASFSSPRPPLSPLSPLLVSQPSNPKTASGSIKDYEIIKAISKGAYGSVFLAKRRLTGDYVAIKFLKKGDMIAKNQVLNVRSERAVMMKQSDSPYVAQLHCSFQTKEYLCLVMEYLNGGDCATLLKMLGTLGDKWAKRYIAEVIVGVNDLHKRGIIHRDLKPDNLLIDSRGHLKLTDFGLSRIGVVGRHTFKHRKSSASEHGIDLFRKSISNNMSTQSPLINSTALESPELLPNSHKRNLSVTPFSLSPTTDMIKPTAGPMVLSQDSAIPGYFSQKKRSKSHFRTSSIKSGSTASSYDLPLLNYVVPKSPSESSFAIVDDEFLMSPSQDHEIINSYALFDPKQERTDLKKFVGTPDYLAPETITGESQGEYSDWWSIGCILFESLYGYPPFHADTPLKVFQNILNGDIDWPPLPKEQDEEICPPQAKDLIKKLLTLDFEERLGVNGAEEIMNHPYFEGINWDSLYKEDPDSFIPTLDDPESTEYFDLRGADLAQIPKDDSDEETSSQDCNYRSSSSETVGTTGSHLAVQSSTPLARRERRGSKLADPNEFGLFNFRNLNVLEKANKEVISRLKNEHFEHRSSLSSSSSDSFTPGHVKSRGSSITSNVVTLGSPFKRPVSPANTTNISPNKDKLNRKTREGSAVGTAKSESRHRFLAPSLSKQLLLKNASEAMHSPATSDNEDSSFALFRIRQRRESMRHSSISGSHSLLGVSSVFNDSPSTQDLDVLYCEPIPIVRHTVSKMLEKNGCIVLNISDGDDLIQRATSKVKFDLIFTELRLPKVDAIDAVKLIKYTSGNNSMTPIIAVTGFAKEALDLGAFDDVLEKPVEAALLQNVIAKYTRHSAIDA